LRLKILEKLRTANLNSEFNGFYKKKCNCISCVSKLPIKQINTNLKVTVTNVFTTYCPAYKVIHIMMLHKGV